MNYKNTMSQSGSITLYIGCMFSGKTSELQREYKRWKNVGKSVVSINYVGDDRYGVDDYIYNHDNTKIPCIKAFKLSDIEENVLKHVDVILINEGQFFVDIIEFCVRWCDEFKKNVIVCGLDGDFMRKPFGKINDLIPLCDEVRKLKALCKVCADGTYGLFSWRVSKETEQVIIGDVDKYIPVCRKHYIEFSKTVEKEKNIKEILFSKE